LRHSRAQKALVLGSFTSADPNEYDAATILIRWWNTCEAGSIPVITGLAFGHEQETVTLPLGAHAY
jgi:muramoyltetrapeptide carboxypeptidase